MGRTPIFSEHAKLRLALRGITSAEALLAVRQPDTIQPARDGATNYWKHIDGRTIRVTLGVDLFDPKQPVVVTVAIKETS